MKTAYFKSSGFVKVFWVVILLVCTFFFFGFKNVETDTSEITMDIKGDFFVYLNINDEYIEQGVLVTENGFDVSPAVTIDGQVDTSVPGEYIITYTYKSISEIRTIYVSSDTPYIHLLGDAYIVLNLGEAYVETGCVAFDEQNQNISESILINGNVDVNMPGQYIIDYSVITAQGYILIAQRVVEVAALSTEKTPDDYADFLDGAVFLGDSITLSYKAFVNSQRKIEEGFFGEAKFLAENSYSLRVAANYKDGYHLHPEYNGRRLRPQYSLKAMGAKKVFIVLGVNDIYTSKETILENYDKLIGKIIAENPGIEIYMVSIFPMTKARESAERNNEKIADVNSGLREYANANGFPFIDITDIFLVDRQVDASLYRDNYVHLNNNGFEILSDTLISAFQFFAQQDQSRLGQVINVEQSANLRSTPSMDFEPIGEILLGDEVEIMPEYFNPNWYYVSYNGQQGYIHKSLVMIK